MSKEGTLILFGVLVALMPFLGFPRSWETVASVLIGFGIIALVFFSRRSRISRVHDGNEKRTDAFVENGFSRSRSYLTTDGVSGTQGTNHASNQEKQQ